MIQDLRSFFVQKLCQSDVNERPLKDIAMPNVLYPKSLLTAVLQPFIESVALAIKALTLFVHYFDLHQRRMDVLDRAAAARISRDGVYSGPLHIEARHLKLLEGKLDGARAIFGGMVASQYQRKSF